MNKPTLTIGIAAYNEAQNIGTLLSALLRQRIDTADLVEIIVVSDESTDGTDDIVRSFQDRVRLVRVDKRSGASHAQGVIMEQATGDILALLDADTLPIDDLFITNLIFPLIADTSVGLASAMLEPAAPQTFIEKVLARNHEFKRDLFASIGDGNNLYTCFGPARAFVRKLYSTQHCPDNCPVDAASYMLCIISGLRFVSVSSTRAIFRCPTNLTDHLKQSTRFLSGKKAVIDAFGERASNAYVIPKSTFWKAMIKEFMMHPILFLSFILISLFVRGRQQEVFSSKWEMAISSKKI